MTAASVLDQSGDFKLRSIPPSCRRWVPADAMTPTPRMKGTSRCVRELTAPRSPALWKIDRCYRALRDCRPIQSFSRVASSTWCPNESSKPFIPFARASVLPAARRYFGAIVNIPFGRVDGLAKSINGILKMMEQDIHTKVPDAISTAQNDVIAVVRRTYRHGLRLGISSCDDYL